MATVYRAYQASLQRHVALKVLSPRLVDDLELVNRFLREARSAAALRHPNVMIVHDVGSEGDLHYIVSELLEGITLAQLLQQEGALPPERVLNIMRQVASALDYAHSRGYIHRDIKPSNIMIDPGRDDHVTLMDFGLVQVSGDSRITRAGFIMGTPDYMSPEQAKGDPVDHRTDVYSLGVTLYHALVGTVPFAKSTPHAVLLAHIMEDPPDMSAVEHDISPQIESAVRKALSKDPRDRYEWAGDLVKDLEMAVRHPDRFTIPLEQPPAYPYTPPTVRAQSPSLPGETGRTHEHEPAAHPTYVIGSAPQPQAPSIMPQGKRAASWVWPVVGLASFAAIAVLAILGILFWPQIRPLVVAAQPTVTAEPTATQAPDPQILLFDVSPAEIVQGGSVTLTWNVTETDSVTIHPGVLDKGLPQDSMVHQPDRTTTYRLELPGGVAREAQVIVLPAPLPPVIDYLAVDPSEPVRGQEFTLSWRVSGDASRVEISYGLERIPVSPADRLVLVAEEATTFVLDAYNGDLVATAEIGVQVVEPTPTSTLTPPPTATSSPSPQPTATSTRLPPTPTPVVPTATAVPTATPSPSSGVIVGFEESSIWTRGEQPYGEFTRSREQVHAGSFAAKLSYDFTAAGSTDDFVVFRNSVSLGGQPKVITVWVYGDGSGHFLNAWVEDALGQVWSVHLGPLSFSGWQQLTGLIASDRPWPSGKVSGPDNNRIDFPIRLYALVLDRPGSGPMAGQVYLDDIAIAQAAVTTPPESTATPQAGEPVPGQMGRILFTVKVDETRYSLYTTDPDWTKAVKVGDTDWNNSTCAEDSTTAGTFDGALVQLRPLDRCQIAGTVGSCPSPDGRFKVNTNNMGDRFSVVLFSVAENRIQEAYYEGPLNIYVGLNWAPDSSHFLFTADSSVYRADVGHGGAYRVIPFKDPEWPLQYSSDGNVIMYLKPVNGAIADVFVAQPDGSGERNLTNASISVKLCPRWVRR